MICLRGSIAINGEEDGDICNSIRSNWHCVKENASQGVNYVVFG